MRWIRIVILVFAFIEAGWMAFDGSRALIVGQLITPSSGWFLPLGTVCSLAQIVVLVAARSRLT